MAFEPARALGRAKGSLPGAIEALPMPAAAEDVGMMLALWQADARAAAHGTLIALCIAGAAVPARNRR